jgi:hypothetical protein
MATGNSVNEGIITALHYLFSHAERNKVVAHCLDLDLVASGDDVRTAEERLNTLVRVQIGSCYSCGNFGQLRFKAPPEYWEAQNDAKELPRAHLEIEVPPVVLPVDRSEVTLLVFRSEKALAAVA